MLVVDPIRRLGVSQICRHKWVRQCLGLEHAQFLVDIESNRDTVQKECDSMTIDQVNNKSNNTNIDRIECDSNARLGGYQLY